MDRVIVAGDSGNDIDMIADCPNAIVVANHEVGLLDKLPSQSIYLARRRHAAGVLEGLVAYLEKIESTVGMAA